MVRRIRGLKWARELTRRPNCIPLGRPRGLKALGVRYEKALAKALPEADHGRWFEYEDEGGHGYGQADFILGCAVASSLTRQTILLEAKYTWTREGHDQMEWLYGPLVRATRRLEARPGTILVCRALTAETRNLAFRVVDCLEEALALARPDRRVVLQWLPSTPLRISAALAA